MFFLLESLNMKQKKPNLTCRKLALFELFVVMLILCCERKHSQHDRNHMNWEREKHKFKSKTLKPHKRKYKSGSDTLFQLSNFQQKTAFCLIKILYFCTKKLAQHYSELNGLKESQKRGKEQLSKSTECHLKARRENV